MQAAGSGAADRGDQRRQRILNARQLRRARHLAEHLLKARLHRAGDDVLPAVGPQHGRGDGLRLLAGDAGNAAEVAGIGLRLRLQDAVDAATQRDQVVHRGVALYPSDAKRSAPLASTTLSRSLTQVSKVASVNACDDCGLCVVKENRA